MKAHEEGWSQSLKLFPFYTPATLHIKLLSKQTVLSKGILWVSKKDPCSSLKCDSSLKTALETASDSLP
jgi:hypothetical protein